MKKIQMLLALAFMVFAAKAATPADSSKTVNGKSYVLHTVAKGETLYGLAQKYKTTVADLKKANNNMETLKTGQAIWVPGKGAVSAMASGNGAAQKKHTVLSGESLSKIAKKYGIEVVALQKANNLKGTDIKVGQTLLIPAAGAAKEPAVIVVKEESKEMKAEPKKEEKKAEEKAEKEKAKAPVKPVVKAEDGSSTPIGTATIDRVGEIEEKGMVKIDINSDMDQTRCFIKHPSIPKGNIIVVINPESGKMAYCRVVENYEAKKGDNVNAYITQAVAQKIGLGASSGQVTLKYATP